MTDFDIRILNPDGSASIVTTMSAFSTQSAIGSAVRLSRGRQFEVWGEGRCLYTSAPSAASTQLPPNSPAA